MIDETGAQIATSTDHLPIGSHFAYRWVPRLWVVFRVCPFGDRVRSAHMTRRGALRSMRRLARAR